MHLRYGGRYAEELLVLDDKHVKSWQLLSVACFEQGNHAGAAEALRRALSGPRPMRPTARREKERVVTTCSLERKRLFAESSRSWIEWYRSAGTRLPPSQLYTPSGYTYASACCPCSRPGAPGRSGRTMRSSARRCARRSGASTRSRSATPGARATCAFVRTVFQVEHRHTYAPSQRAHIVQDLDAFCRVSVLFFPLQARHTPSSNFP